MSAQRTNHGDLNGYSQHFHPLSGISAITHKYIHSDDYLFFLGNTDPKKNVPRTLKAYSLYLKRSSRKRPLLIADLREDKLGYDIERAAYRGNQALPVLPRLHLQQGFGILVQWGLRLPIHLPKGKLRYPMLEAMACGTPVITGNTSAMPEIAGKGGLLADPFNEEEVASLLLRLEEDQAFHDEQIKYGLQRSRLFSWNHTARKLLQVYMEVIQSLKK